MFNKSTSVCWTSKSDLSSTIMCDSIHSNVCCELGHTWNCCSALAFVQQTFLRGWFVEHPLMFELSMTFCSEVSLLNKCSFLGSCIRCSQIHNCQRYDLCYLSQTLMFNKSTSLCWTSKSDLSRVTKCDSIHCNVCCELGQTWRCCSAREFVQEICLRGGFVEHPLMFELSMTFCSAFYLFYVCVLNNK